MEGAAVSCFISITRLYSTLLPQAAGRQLTDSANAHHGNFTPPRIAPSCPHCLRLWLGRSIMIAGECRGEQLCCFRADGLTLCTLSIWPSFDRSLQRGVHLLRLWPLQVVLAHPPVSLAAQTAASSADVSRCRI